MSAQELPTVESILAFMRESAKEADERQRKRDEEFAAMRAETVRLAKEAEERRKEADERRKEIDERRRKLDEEFAAMRAETDRLRREVEERSDKVNESIGRLGNRVGYIVETLIIPNAVQEFNKLGFDFITVAPRHYWTIKGRVAVEVDVWLTNGASVMAIEVKTNLTKNGVDEHLSRLNKLRTRDQEFGLTDKKIYGAVSGSVIEEDAKNYALASGLYVIEQVSRIKIGIIAPSGEFPPKAW